MHRRRVDPAWIATLVLAFASVAAGCATNPAPGGWLTRAEDAGHAAYGGWLQLELRRGGDRVRPDAIEGEFLAVGPDSLVRVLTDVGVIGVSVRAVERARLTGYDVNQTVGLWTFPGFLLTASNGGYLILTAPYWILSGIGATHNAWSTAKESVPRRSWNDLRIYARFPAGWPEGLDPASIQPDARWPAVAEGLLKERERIEKAARASAK